MTLTRARWEKEEEEEEKPFTWRQQTRNVKCVNNLLVVVWGLCVLVLFCKLEFLFFSSFFLCKGCTKTGCAKLMTVCFKYGSIFNRIHILKHYFAHGLQQASKERRAQVGGTLCVVPSTWGGYSYPPSVQKTLLIQPRVLNTSKQ